MGIATRQLSEVKLMNYIKFLLAFVRFVPVAIHFLSTLMYRPVKLSIRIRTPCNNRNRYAKIGEAK